MTRQHLPHSPGAALRRIALASALMAALGAAGSAHATFGTPATADPSGLMENISYGSGGEIFQLEPLLYVLGLNSLGNAKAVADSSGALQFSYAVSGQGSSLMTIDYRLHNASITNQSFSDLRFAVFANPDGGSDLRDVLSQTWGSKTEGAPERREGRAFKTLGIISDFRQNNNLTEGPPALDPACTAAPGCEATVGLQWDADTLAPGETFHVRLGLSDNGETLSAGRFLTITSVSNPGTVLTFSGQSTILSAVPEPGAAAMLLAGLAGLGFMARRRQRT